MGKDKIVNLENGTGASKTARRRDRIFADRRDLITDFAFDEKTASVFDDMVSRSVPFYHEIQRMVSEIAADFAAPGTRLYDLGCATGTTMLAMDASVDPSVTFVGVDNSSEMLKEAERKLARLDSKRPYELVEADIDAYSSEIDATSVVLMVLTLQFIRPLRRQRVIQKICERLRPNGCLILVEKLSLSSTLLNRLFIKYYYEMKRRNGYSDVEISQKREALENVLVPYRPEENRDMLRDAGFSQIEEFFRWYNFCGIIAVK